jgi:ribosomal protein S13
VRRARHGRALLAELKAGTVTLADVLGRDDDLARKTKVAQVVRALPGVGQARAAAALENARIPPDRRVGGLGARQREQLLAEFAGR